ncbi:hypothetical protein N7522_011604 [Penicillium canescens]|nr:hypothetical protein N7522_011604 [Penicillium canescens]
MASIYLSVDLERGILRITYNPKAIDVRSSCRKRVPSAYEPSSCLRAYASLVVSAFFIELLGVACTLARFSSLDAELNIKPSNLASIWKNRFRRLATLDSSSRADRIPRQNCQKYVLVSNEMSVLIVSRLLVNYLNKIIRANTKPTSGVSKAIGVDLFTSNIVVAERACQAARAECPYAEDHWSSIRIGQD